MSPRTPIAARTLVLTALALVAFAANSILCRKALGADAIDAASFTSVRIASGAIVLAVLATRRARGVDGPRVRGSWRSAAWLVLYALAFSFAYRALTAGTGALLLFGLVQLTMLLAAVRAGERPPALEWLGLALAAAGLVALVLPGLSAPPAHAALLMAAAGVAWGLYSLRGKSSKDALGDTAGNFARAVPMALVASAASVLLAHDAHATPAGLALAAASGAVTSGLGYVAWYAALSGLTSARAAIVQLAVPVIAALGGVLLLGEPITPRLALCGATILGGIALALVSRRA
ncbi:MAG: DMT family transporter [Planctomycetes bacterium]|nr:DMT family transporter [Planctomycetota bacterium]